MPLYFVKLEYFKLRDIFNDIILIVCINATMQCKQVQSYRGLVTFIIKTVKLLYLMKYSISSQNVSIHLLYYWERERRNFYAVAEPSKKDWSQKHPTLNLKVTFLVLKRKLWNSMATMSWEMHPYASHTIFFNVRLNELATTFCQLLLAKAFVDNIGVAVHATQTLLQYSPVVVLCSATPKSCDITSYVYSLMHNITELLATVTWAQHIQITIINIAFH